MKLPFFPIPYPDEILYSVFARYHVYSGNNASKITSRELFGSPTKASLVQVNMNQFIENLPPFYPLTLEDFYNNHTLLPFFSPFISEERYLDVKNSMGGKSKRGGFAQSKLGLTGGSMSLSHYMYYCPDCFKENTIVHGEAYWHRVHQVPGVLSVQTI